MHFSLVNNFGNPFRELRIKFEAPKLLAFIHHDSRSEGTGIHTPGDRESSWAKPRSRRQALERVSVLINRGRGAIRNQGRTIVCMS
jgi:hypothetical protein